MPAPTTTAALRAPLASPLPLPNPHIQRPSPSKQQSQSKPKPKPLPQVQAQSQSQSQSTKIATVPVETLSKTRTPLPAPGRQQEEARPRASSSKAPYAHAKSNSASSSSSNKSGSLTLADGRRLSVRRATPADALGIARVCLHAVASDAERRQTGRVRSSTAAERGGRGDGSGSAHDGKDRDDVDDRAEDDAEEADARSVKAVCARMRHAELPAAVQALPYLHLQTGFAYVLVESVPVASGSGSSSSTDAREREKGKGKEKAKEVGGAVATAGPSTMTTTMPPINSATAGPAWARRAAHLDNLRSGANASAHPQSAPHPQKRPYPHPPEGGLGGHGRGESVASNASNASAATALSGVSAFSNATGTTARTSMASAASGGAGVGVGRKQSKTRLGVVLTPTAASGLATAPPESTSFLELAPPLSATRSSSPRGPRSPDRSASAVSSRSQSKSSVHLAPSPVARPRGPRGPRPLPKVPTMSASPGPGSTSTSTSTSTLRPLAAKTHDPSPLLCPPPPPPSLPHPGSLAATSSPSARLAFLPALTPPPPPRPALPEVPLHPQPPALTLPAHHPSAEPVRSVGVTGSVSTLTSRPNASTHTHTHTPEPSQPASHAHTERIVGYVLGTPSALRFAKEADARWWPRLRRLYPRDMPGTPLDRHFVARIHDVWEEERRERRGRMERRREKGRGVLRLGMPGSADARAGEQREEGSTDAQHPDQDEKAAPTSGMGDARSEDDDDDPTVSASAAQLHVCVMSRVREAGAAACTDGSGSGAGGGCERLLVDAAMRHLRALRAAERDNARVVAEAAES